VTVDLCPSASMDQSLVVVFADPTLIVLNKPAGLLTVPGKGADKQDCLIGRVRCWSRDALVVHRLDMATSGLLVVARSRAIQRQLSIAFADRSVGKRYVAVVSGRVAASAGQDWQLIDLPVAPDWPNRPRQQVDAATGKPSQTLFRILGYDAATDATRLELAPQTGRTHQLRVHLLAIGHPIWGDQLYAPPSVQAKASRLLLHASRLCLPHPEAGEPMSWDCAPPF
jgi:tRNA pseudouridine32 synthase / 23S rRNA pseudouridine746 synthase